MKYSTLKTNLKESGTNDSTDKLGNHVKCSTDQAHLAGYKNTQSDSGIDVT